MALIVVAVGVVVNRRGEVLIARRPEHVHQGGLWEFPGGKLEAGENVVAALRRELREELGISITHTEPLLCIEHDYGDKKVLLDVLKVTSFSGEPVGVEGQPLRWVALDGLREYAFPAANEPILQRLMASDTINS